MICVTGVYSREIINMFFISQVCGLVENFNIKVYLLRYHKHDKYQTLHDGTTPGALPVHTTFNDLDHISRPLQCRNCFNWKFCVLS